MSRRCGLIVLGTLFLTLSVSAAGANPSFSYDPPSIANPVQNCVSQFKVARGLAATIVDQLNGAKITIHYKPGGGAGTHNPSPGNDPTGKPLDIDWDSNQTGNYADGAPRVPCAVLLHELEHAARYFTGQECTGPEFDENKAVEIYDESLGSRAENWWLSQQGLQPQRTSYILHGQPVPLDRWTRWPASPTNPVPPAPRCFRRACESLKQDGCIEFHGGVYSGGDNRGVATGSLEIETGDLGYCNNRIPCRLRNCTVCSHLDTAFPSGVTVTATATAGKDSTFAGWGAGACRGQGATCTFTAQRRSCINALFLLANPTAPPQTLPAVPCPEDP